MKILITNEFLDLFGGSEAWCYAIASELKRRQYDVFIYTPLKGKIYKEFEKLGILFSNTGHFDLILDNHNLIKNFTSDVIIHTCHGITPLGQPIKNNNIINVAVSEGIGKKWGVNKIITNGIDTNRFFPITKPRKKLQKILSLCKSDTANDILKIICNDINVDLEIMYGKEIFNIENKINESDLVIGVGRSLLDAMSCGRPVISFDDRFYFKTRMLGYGYITPDKFDKYIKDSFTGNAEQKTLTKLDLVKEIVLKYNPNDGEINRKFILENYNISKTVDEYLKIYNKYKK